VGRGRNVYAPQAGTIGGETYCLDARSISSPLPHHGDGSDRFEEIGMEYDLLQAIGGLHLAGALPSYPLQTQSRHVPRPSAGGG